MKNRPDFTLLSRAVDARLVEMQQHGRLFRTDIDPYVLAQDYLDAFPAGTNDIYRERSYYDCSCCKHFIRQVGNVVAITEDFEVMTVWDLQGLPRTFQTVANALHRIVMASTIVAPAFFESAELGNEVTYSYEGDMAVYYDHFYGTIKDQAMVKKDVGFEIGTFQADVQVFARTVTEISLQAGLEVDELITDGSLYRGDEKRHVVKRFIEWKKEYEGLATIDPTAWLSKKAMTLGGMVRVRNDVMGTLLVDISNGVDLTTAVKKFEDKMYGGNYKRPKALVTARQIKMAEDFAVEHGLIDSLPRVHAILADVDPNNVLHVNRSLLRKPQSETIFGSIKAKDDGKKPNFDRINEVSMDKFVNDVLPNASQVEVFFDGTQQSNLVNMTVGQNAWAEPLLAWDNSFAWTYRGSMADSETKRLVEEAGGNVSGELRVSLRWFNGDDLDLHCRMPSGRTIYYGNKRHGLNGWLDVDHNAGSPHSETKPVENIAWDSVSKMEKGRYKLWVNQYSQRRDTDFGFKIEIELFGNVWNMEYNEFMRKGKDIHVADIVVDSTGQATVEPALPAESTNAEVWGLDTNKFHVVSSIMKSPNFWGHNKGNEHLFFMIDGCRNDEESVRGFFNEFLRPDLIPHRKTFEHLGRQMMVPYSDDQLAGLGFSSTKRDNVIVRVTGATTRVMRVQL